MMDIGGGRGESQDSVLPVSSLSPWAMSSWLKNKN